MFSFLHNEDRVNAWIDVLFPTQREPSGGGGGTPKHYLYGYVPPKGVVIFKLLI